MSVQCPHCGGLTVQGDLRSGVLSFGDFFVEHDPERRTFTGAPKPRPGVQRDNRVLSFACEQCGLVSSYLERVVRKHSAKAVPQGVRDGSDASAV